MSTTRGQSPEKGESKLPREPRRMHHKSRRGCKECKRRHIKCDERRPYCVNCSVSRRKCVYLTVAPSAPDVLAPSSSSGGPDIYVDRATSPGDASPTTTPSVLPCSRGQNIRDSQDQLFTLEHLRLLHHVEHGITTWLGATESMVPLVQQYVQTALTTPYLMHQLLALSALHLSHFYPNETIRYRSLATELQTRGLSLFNAAHPGNGDDTTPSSRWYFSSLLSMHNLATTLAESPNQDFDAFLNGFVDHMRLHQGAQAMGKDSWGAILLSSGGGGFPSWLHRLVKGVGEQQQAPLPLSRTSSNNNPSSSSFSSTSVPEEQESLSSLLTRMLATSRLNAPSIDTCQQAVTALVQVHGRMQSWGPHAAMSWPNLIPREFICLLGERIPEALVILAHYAQVVHAYRGFWVFGDSGRYMIAGLATRLGTGGGPWGRWIERPVAAALGGNRDATSIG